MKNNKTAIIIGRLINRWKITLIVIAFIAVVAFTSVYYIFWMPNRYDDPKGKIVIIPRGASFRAAVDSLADVKAVRSKWAFLLAGRLLGYTKSIKIGKYLFVSGQSNLDILRDMKIGKSRFIIPVTLPEGWRMEKIAHRFERDLGIDAKIFLALCHDEQFIHEQGIDAKSLEGYLLPDTYSFYWQTDEQEIIGRMLESFKRFYVDSLLQRQKQLETTQLEVLTLASIVEAESSLNDERPVIAGVYWNRLKKRMRLEADPTIQYAIGEGRRLTFEDLDVASPYNTYRHYGLPPGPINNPGRSAILAVLFPTQHSYFYFVAKGINGHYFAKSYSDHQKNIRQYHRTRREMKRLSN